MDTQIKEIIGKNRLVNELLEAGLEVALPLRDRGIDLIAYLDVGDGLSRFVAVPIQMKASTRFIIDRKYEKFPELLYAYVWGLDDENEPVTYAMTHAEAVALATAKGYTNTSSWLDAGLYSAAPNAELIRLLEPYKMTAAGWRSKIESLLS